MELIPTNSGSNTKKYKEMKKSIDMIIVQLIEDEEKFKQTTNFLINFFNKKSFREENDYLMDAMLKQTSCMLSEDFQTNLNRYYIY